MRLNGIGVRKTAEYEELLKKAHERLPEKVETKRRIVVPRVACLYEGNKTKVKNLGEISSRSKRDKKHISKFLLKELATSGSVQDNTLVFKGRISMEMLHEKILDYVEEFVLCKECGKPDTELIKEGQKFFLVCEVNGHRYPVRSI